jgi:outer membrane beta-barrel protein
VNLISLLSGVIVVALILVGAADQAVAGPGGYKKATEGDDVVKNKLYPKKGKVELNLPNVGMILNQSYLDTYIVNGGINYFWSEVWGAGIDFSYAINKDRGERECVESFYNDPDYQVDQECGGEENLTGRANYGPAYVNIREYNSIISANAIWNPIYGKEIFFLSAVGYFDVYATFGAGLASTTFYPQSTTLRNDRESRGTFPATGTAGAPGASPTETDEDGRLLYGKEGRPDPVKETKIVLEAGAGQKFHFGKALSFKLELRDHLVLGTPGGFDMFFTLWGGLGLRF